MKLTSLALLMAFSAFAQNGEIQVTVKGDNKPLVDAKVTLVDSKKQSIDKNKGDGDGLYRFDKLAAGEYQVSVKADQFKDETKMATVAEDKPLKLDFALSKAVAPADAVETKKDKAAATESPCPPQDLSSSSFYWLAGLLVAFWFAVLTARYNNIATVNRKLLEAEIEKTRQQLASIPVGSKHTRINELVRKAEETNQAGIAEKPSTFLYWTRGHEISAWVQLHEAQRIIATTFNREQTIARLRIASEELRPDFVKVAETVDAALAATVTEKPPTTAYLSALLSEALSCIYDGVDDSFQLVFSWQNKAFTLLFLGSCVLLAIAGGRGNGLLMVMGLAGGLVSRLLRGARGTEIPSDYGANWTSLFMSPIYGAFAGWFGVLILAAMKDMDLLGAAFKGLCWADAQRIPLALAFLFGFSERLFTTVTDSLEKVVNDNLRKTAANPPGASGGASGGVAPKDPPTPVVPGSDVQITHVSFAVPGKALTIEGQRLDGVRTVRLGDQLIPITSNQPGVMQLGPVPSVSAGIYDLWFDTVKAARVEVPGWSIASVSAQAGTIVINGNSLNILPDPLSLKQGAITIALTRAATSTAQQVTAAAIAAPAAGRYQLMAHDVFTGMEVTIP